MDTNYTITEIKGIYDSNYPDSKKYKFMVDGYPTELSVFSKFPMSVGQEITGHIEVNGIYHNFKFGKKSSSTFQKGGTTPDLNRIEMKLDAILASQSTIGGTLTGMKGVLADILSKLPQNDADHF